MLNFCQETNTGQLPLTFGFSFYPVAPTNLWLFFMAYKGQDGPWSLALVYFPVLLLVIPSPPGH